MILTLKELADYLKVNERTIMRMLKNGQVQGAKIGGQWRFNSRQIDALFFPEPMDNSADYPLDEISQSHIGIPLSRCVSKEHVVLNLKAKDVAGVITEMVDSRLLNALVYDIQGLREKCLAREALLSTGVGNGIAIPHPRDPEPTLRAPGIVILGCSRKGIDFQAIDGQPVHLFFLLCCQSIKLHLHLMGRLARILRNPDFAARCLACRTAKSIIRLIMDAERQEFLSS